LNAPGEPYELPMFPLGSVLFPHAVTSLHIFEPRYRALAEYCTAGNGEFGVVLIERGHEVGGGDSRFAVGTVARIVEAATLEDGRWLLAAIGDRRIDVLRWLPEDPYPKALVADRTDRVLALGDHHLVEAAERLVRRGLAYKIELDEAAVPATVELDADADVRAFQLAAVAPIGPLDRQLLLAEDDPRARVLRLTELVEDENRVLAHRLAEG
jgi:Lon protease-like protein